MSSEPGQPRPAAVSSRPSQEFAGYCEAEFERRRNSGAEFDEAAYQAAMEMVLTKLRLFEDEGQA